MFQVTCKLPSKQLLFVMYGHGNLFHSFNQDDCLSDALFLLLFLTVPLSRDQRKELFPWFLSIDYSDSSPE
ncbi:hypothetical protein STEG23_016504 [Scotinomys teguina]